MMKKVAVLVAVLLGIGFGAPLSAVESSGGIKSMEQLIDNETFKFCAIEMVGHKYFGSVPNVADEERKKMLEEVAGIAASWPVK